MNSQQQSWYNAGADILARAGFSLAMCGALVGVLYATANNGSGAVSASSAGSPARTATVLASFDGSSGIYQSQAVVDASPVSMPDRPKIPMPPERVPEAGLASARYAVLPTKRPDRQSVAAASNVVRFESCLPDCETHDPLIVGHAEKASSQGLSPLPTDELVEDVSFTETTPSILGRALRAPGIVYRTGRNALTTLVHAAL